MVKVSLNGKTYEYPEGTRYLEIAADMQKDYSHDIVLVSVNKRLRELNKKLYEDAELVFTPRRIWWGPNLTGAA